MDTLGNTYYIFYSEIMTATIYSRTLLKIFFQFVKLGAVQHLILVGQSLKNIFMAAQLLFFPVRMQLLALLVTVLANQHGLPIIGSLVIHH